MIFPSITEANLTHSLTATRKTESDFCDKTSKSGDQHCRIILNLIMIIRTARASRRSRSRRSRSRNALWRRSSTLRTKKKRGTNASNFHVLDCSLICRRTHTLFKITLFLCFTRIKIASKSRFTMRKSVCVILQREISKILIIRRHFGAIEILFVCFARTRKKTDKPISFRVRSHIIHVISLNASRKRTT